MNIHMAVVVIGRFLVNTLLLPTLHAAAGTNTSYTSVGSPTASKADKTFEDSLKKRSARLSTTQKPTSSTAAKSGPFDVFMLTTHYVTDPPKCFEDASVCGNNVTDNALVFPVSCFSYPNNHDCRWTIRRNYSYYLEFTKFAIQHNHQCDHDYLRIGDGEKMCGFNRPTRIFVEKTNGTTEVVFHSDPIMRYPGFALKIVKEKDIAFNNSCGGVVTDFLIDYPTNQSNYPPNIRCRWIVQVNYAFLVKFSRFDIEGSVPRRQKVHPYYEKLWYIHCMGDFLQVGKGKRLCGGDVYDAFLPDDIYVNRSDTATDIVFESSIVYGSKKLTSAKGFKLEIFIQDPPPRPLIPTNVTIDGPLKEITCTVHTNKPSMITWYKISKQNDRTQLSSNLTTAILPIGVVSVGDYACEASNEFGSSEALMTVFSNSLSNSGIQDKDLIIGLSVLSALLVVLMGSIGSVLYYQRQKRFPPEFKPNPEWKFDPDRSLQEQISELPYNLNFEFPRLDVTLKNIVGEGNFGEVWKGLAEGIRAFSPKDTSELILRSKLANITTREHNGNDFWVKYFRKEYYPAQYSDEGVVAVKCLKPGAPQEHYKLLAEELKLMIHLGTHKNIVNLLGACTQKRPLWVILEYCSHGDLRNYLRSKALCPTWNRSEIETSTIQLCWMDLMRMSMEIAEGMIFLSVSGIVHRDLAARNVLVGSDMQMKICDFGLARNVEESKGEYNKDSETAIPVRWTAPEAINVGTYSVSSDVWSYGVTIWELFSLGHQPYGGLSNYDVKTMVGKGDRMEAPASCPANVYIVMKACWNSEPKERPDFMEIFEMLLEVKRRVFAPSDDYYTGTEVSAAADIYVGDEFIDCRPILREQRIKWLNRAGITVTEHNKEDLLAEIWGGETVVDEENVENVSIDCRLGTKSAEGTEIQRLQSRPDHTEEQGTSQPQLNVEVEEENVINIFDNMAFENASEGNSFSTIHAALLSTAVDIIDTTV